MRKEKDGNDNKPRVLANRTNTIAEHIELMLRELKQVGSQNGVSYNIKHKRLIVALDNNRDEESFKPWEEFEATARKTGAETRRIIDGKYDWWIMVQPVADAETAMLFMLNWEA